MLALPAFTGTPRENEVYHVDALTLLRAMPSASINCIVTSPPYYGLRDYGAEGQIGLEETPEQYVAALVALFREARRVLRDDGTLWLNLADSYVTTSAGNNLDAFSAKQRSNAGAISRRERAAIPSGLKLKDLMGIPWRVAFALQADGWYLRADIIWAKPNPMPESVVDRPTKAHEYVFLLSKSNRYYYDIDAIREPFTDNSVHRDTGTRGTQGYSAASGVNTRPQRDSNGGLGKHPLGRNKRSVWTVRPASFEGAHFATFPPDLIEPMILAGCPAGGLVYDPFFGSGTTGLVARQLGRRYIGSEINIGYVEMARRRLDAPYTPDMFAGIA